MFKSLLIIAFITLTFNADVIIEQEQISIPLSKPHERGILVVKHQKGSINIQGYDGVVVLIDATYRYQQEFDDHEEEGMKKIQMNNMKLSATEEDNRVIVRVNSFDKTVDLNIQVPHNFDLFLKTIDNGEISVHDVAGTLEISNVEGSITLNNISGSAVANTVDGNIIATFNHVDDETPMAFSTVDGKIDVKFPADTKALLKMKSDYGDVFSDFEIALQERKNQATRNEETGIYRVEIEEWTYGKINKGEREILLKSLDGNIYIRKGK